MVHYFVHAFHVHGRLTITASVLAVFLLVLFVGGSVGLWWYDQERAYHRRGTYWCAADTIVTMLCILYLAWFFFGV